MDCNNDQEWQSYWASMMLENSPASFSRQSASSSPYDRFYEADDIGVRDVSYEDEERSDEDEDRADNCEVGVTPMNGDDAPSPSDDDRRGSRSTKKKRSKRKRRDPNKPKGCLTAVLLYSNANRSRVKVENPELNFGDIVSCSWRPRLLALIVCVDVFVSSLAMSDVVIPPPHAPS
jgi:hypothetical protein